MNKPIRLKPEVKFNRTKESGNIFSILSQVRQEFLLLDRINEFYELWDRLNQGVKSYEEALEIIKEYVNLVEETPMTERLQLLEKGFAILRDLKNRYFPISVFEEHGKYYITTNAGYIAIPKEEYDVLKQLLTNGYECE